MDSVKQLTGKNKREYEQAACRIINDADVNSFENLVSKEDFLFDFVKQNAAKRLQAACNKDNYKNLISFLNFYSPSYDTFIAQVLSKFGDAEIKEKMFDLLKNGSDNQKAYAAKYFSFVEDERTVDFLKKSAYSDFEPLAFNCAEALSALKERTCIDEAYEKLNSQDDFEVLAAVKFLSAYGEKNALRKIFDIMKKSSVSEFIASEIGYMEPFSNLLDSPDFCEDTLLALNNILQGFGEIISLSNVFSFQLYEVFEKLIFSPPNAKNAIILLMAKNKFNQLTENDEYLFDEDKNTKDEVMAVKELLNCNIDDNLDEFIKSEIDENSAFVYPAVEVVKDLNLIKPLLKANNQTLVLKTAETLKAADKLIPEDKETALEHVSDENIKSIIKAL